MDIVNEISVDIV